MSRVLVAMSGGVDSSVAAALLREAGHQVTGVTLRLWGGPSDSGCCSLADVEDARRVAAQLGIPHYVFNLAEEFEDAVVAPYATAYGEGRTPNPCVECNRVVKFGLLLERAERLGFERLATGHHARVREVAGHRQLLRGADRAKDQSYVLSMLGRRELPRLLLPVGELSKAHVRALAARYGLRTATKAESMDVCFVQRGRRVEFVGSRTGSRPGPIVDVGGETVGRHDGVERFTIGQRRGLAVAAGERRYVVDLDAPSATVTIGPREALLRRAAPVRDVRFADEPIPEDATIEVQTRAHGAAVPGRLARGRVRFVDPQPRVAPGQTVAFYDGEVLLGGAVAA